MQLRGGGVTVKILNVGLEVTEPANLWGRGGPGPGWRLRDLGSGCAGHRTGGWN